MPGDPMPLEIVDLKPHGLDGHRHGPVDDAVSTFGGRRAARFLLRRAELCQQFTTIETRGGDA